MQQTQNLVLYWRATTQLSRTRSRYVGLHPTTLKQKGLEKELTVASLHDVLLHTWLD